MQTITITQAEYDVLLERIRELTLKNQLLEIDVQELKNMLDKQSTLRKAELRKELLILPNTKPL